MTPLLIAGHGTADADGAAQFRQFVKRVGGRIEVPVAGGFIELSPPPVAEAVAELLHGNQSRLVAVPLMLVAAGHAKGDIPAALARERARHPGLSTVYGRPLGPHATWTNRQRRSHALIIGAEGIATAASGSIAIGEPTAIAGYRMTLLIGCTFMPPGYP